jgi:diguanylate cyclase (GGDEF)-like protein
MVVMSLFETTLAFSNFAVLAGNNPGQQDVDACLIVVLGSQPGKRYVINASPLLLGRDSTADIIIDDPSVSRRQVVLELHGDSVHLIDGGSTNGTYVNDVKVSSGQTVVLQRQDRIRIGKTVLKFLPKGDQEAYYTGVLESRAQMDALTQIYNKGFLLEALETQFARARSQSIDLSLMVIDLDKFKQVNDTHGHDVGDLVLVSAARVLAGALKRHGAILGRFGGEEFAALLPGCGLVEALQWAESLRLALENTSVPFNGGTVCVTASIGVAGLTSAVANSQELFRQADQAVYRAKNSGRNRVESA